MKRLERLILAAGLAALGVVLWKVDAVAVFALVGQVRWGLLLIVSQEVVAHVFNAYGWRFAFPPEAAASFPLLELIKLRVAGDAVNYLTPSATIAGEVARTAMLNDSQAAEVRASSVLVAKVTQALAQMLLVLGGITVFATRLPMLAGREHLAYATLGLFLAALAATALLEARRPPPEGAPSGRELSWRDLKAMGHWLRYHYRRHPARFAASVWYFFLGYVWGAFEAYWICRFIGVPVGVATAFLIELLSLGIDAIFFMVPAKVGTQEGGKTAIFAALGLPAHAGFAFGVVRHIRELAWAAGGLALCSIHARAPEVPSPEPSPIQG